jgi:hypothetical protein
MKVRYLFDAYEWICVIYKNRSVHEEANIYGAV